MAPPQPEVDELFDIRNYYYIGNYQLCINEAHKLKKLSPDTAVERDILVYFSYMAQKKFLVVLDEIKATSHDRVKPLKMLAEYLYNKQNREQILTDLDQKMQGNIDVDNDTFIQVAATIYLSEGNREAAYRVLHMSNSLEAMAMSLDILLKIDRVDQARVKLQEMQEKDDDATLTQLAQAWVNIASGPEKLQDAYYIFQEMIDKYGSTPMLLNGQAVSYIGQGKYEEAEQALAEALDKDSNYPDTLINLIVLQHHHGKDNNVAKRYMSQLKDSHPEHSYIKELNQKEQEFERICGLFKPSVQI